MAAIGIAWADGAWIEAGWVTGDNPAWAQTRDAATPAGAPTDGRKRIILPDGRRMLLTPREIAQVRHQIEAEHARQLAEIEAKPTRKRKKAKAKIAAQTQEIAVTGEESIILPPMVSGLEGWDERADLQAAIHQMLRLQEDDALMLLLMVS